MAVIIPSQLRTVIFLDFRSYTLPNRYIEKDLIATLVNLEKAAYDSDFPYNLENLTTSLIVVCVPDGYKIDSEKIKLPYCHRFDYVTEHAQVSWALVRKYEHLRHDGGQINDDDSFYSKSFHLNLSALPKNSDDEVSEKQLSIFLAACSRMTLTAPCTNIQQTKNSKVLATRMLDQLLEALKCEDDIFCPNFRTYLIDNSPNLKTLAAHVGMALNLTMGRSTLTLDQFISHYGSGKLLKLSPHSAAVGTLLLHAKRDTSFLKFDLDSAYQFGKEATTESEYSTLTQLLLIMRNVGLVEELAENFTEFWANLLIEAPEEDHNKVRTLMVQIGLLPAHDAIDYKGLARLKSVQLPRNPKSALLTAVAQGYDSNQTLTLLH